MVLQYEFALKEWHIKKLKLGKIEFELNELIFGDIIIYSYIDIRYVRQNTIESDEKKLDFILNRQSYKNNFKNNAAVAVVVLIILVKFYKGVWRFLYTALPTIFFRSSTCDSLLKLVFDYFINLKTFGVFAKTK